ncbi:MAG: hypothetical protein ABFD49_06135 [Armatimonadota bacterium]|nr:hypothetical protein [bacterium]
MNIKSRFYNRYFGPRGLITAIRISLHREHTGTALALISATIESMAYLSLPENCDVLRDYDFVAWVKKYLHPERMGISPRELWTLRCALLHGHIAQQTDTTGLKPREILFAWGGYSIFEGMKLRPGSRWYRIMTIRASELYKALAMGAEDFGRIYVGNEANSRIVGIRLNKIFTSRMADETDETDESDDE